MTKTPDKIKKGLECYCSLFRSLCEWERPLHCV